MSMIKPLTIVVAASATVLATGLANTAVASTHTTCESPGYSCTKEGYDGWNAGWHQKYYGTGLDEYRGHNCTAHAAFRLMKRGMSDPGGSFGNAKEWHSIWAQKFGEQSVNQVPAVGAIAQWTSGQYGHVSVVEAVGPDYIDVTEDNWNGPTRAKRIYRSSWPENFLHWNTGSQTLLDGDFIQVTGRPEVHRIAGGAPMYVNSWQHFGGQQSLRKVTQAQFDALAAVPRTGTFLRGVPSGRVFEVLNGRPIYVPSWDTVGGPQRTTDVTDDAIDRCDHLNCSPVGHVDEISVDGDQVTVRGWAFDADRLEQGVEIHVYLEKADGTSSTEGHNLGTANGHRPDVLTVYRNAGSNHGFDKRLTTTRTGRYHVYVFAINVENGVNTQLDKRTIQL